MSFEVEMYQLPFTDSPIRSSSKVSFAYSILKANMGEDFDKLFSHKFISYYYDEDEGEGEDKFSFSRNDLWGTREKITIVQDIDLLKNTYADLHFDIARFVSVCLESNIYIYGKYDRSILDQEFLDAKNTIDYYLITGFNLRKKTFLVRYFDINRYCRCCEIDYETFYTSVFNIPNDRVKFYLIKFCNQEEYEFNVDLVIFEFEAYIQSIESKWTKTHNRMYGIAATNALAQYIEETIKRGNTINQIYLLCFAEHKELMLKRVAWLTSQKMLSTNVLKDIELINEKQKRLVDILNYYNLSFDATAYERVSKLMKVICKLEEDCFQRIFMELKIKTQ